MFATLSSCARTLLSSYLRHSFAVSSHSKLSLLILFIIFSSILSDLAFLSSFFSSSLRLYPLSLSPSSLSVRLCGRLPLPLPPSSCLSVSFGRPLGPCLSGLPVRGRGRVCWSRPDGAWSKEGGGGWGMAHPRPPRHPRAGSVLCTATPVIIIFKSSQRDCTCYGRRQRACTLKDKRIFVFILRLRGTHFLPLRSGCRRSSSCDSLSGIHPLSCLCRFQIP